MKRVALFLALLVGVVPQAASAQVVVSDPAVDSYVFKQWGNDVTNALNIYHTAVSGANALTEQIAHTKALLQNSTGIASVNAVWRDGQSEFQALQQLVKVGYGVTAWDKTANDDFRKVFKPQRGDQPPSSLESDYNRVVHDSIQSGYKYVYGRVQQMNGEEQQIQALREMALTKDPSKESTNALLSVALQIADQQLQELRSMERMMAQNYATQYTRWYGLSGSNPAMKQQLADMQAEAFMGIKQPGAP